MGFVGWVFGLRMLIWPPKCHLRCPQNGQNFPISDQHKNHWNHLFYLGEYYTQKRNHSFDASRYMNQSVKSNMYSKKDFVNNAMFSSVSSSGLFPRGPLPLHPGPTDFWDWLRRRLWRLWCLSQSIKGPSYWHFQLSLLALVNLFLFTLQGPASSPSDGLADLLKMGAGIAQGLMAIFNNKVNFLVSLLSDKVMVYTIHKQWRWTHQW